MQVAAKNFTLCNGLSKSNNPFNVLSLTQSAAFITPSNPLSITFIATFTSPSSYAAASPFLDRVASRDNSTMLLSAIATCCLSISLSTLSSSYLIFCLSCSTFLTCSSDMETSLVVFSNSTSLVISSSSPLHGVILLVVAFDTKARSSASFCRVSSDNLRSCCWSCSS